jgi:hypothetical protein
MAQDKSARQIYPGKDTSAEFKLRPSNASENVSPKLRLYGPMTREEDEFYEANDAFYAETKRKIAQKLAADDALDEWYRGPLTSDSHQTSSSRAKHSQAGQPASARQSNQSKHSQGSQLSQHRSDTSKKLSVDFSPLKHEERTTRAAIEAKNENKYFKMMDQLPSLEEPDDENVDNSGVCITRFDYTEIGNTAVEGPAKSPKKKFFGLKLPSFKSFASSSKAAIPPPLPTPPLVSSMSSKAAQVLGAPPPRNRARRPEVTRPIRSETTKSLPGMVKDHSRVSKPYATAGQRHARSTPVPARPDHLRTQKTSPPALPAAFNRDIQASSESPQPPTPPEKDTPPVAKVTKKPSAEFAPGIVALPETDRRGENVLFPPPGRVPDPVKRDPVSADKCPALVEDTAETPTTDGILAFYAGSRQSGEPQQPRPDDRPISHRAHHEVVKTAQLHSEEKARLEREKEEISEISRLLEKRARDLDAWSRKLDQQARAMDKDVAALGKEKETPKREMVQIGFPPLVLNSKREHDSLVKDRLALLGHGLTEYASDQRPEQQVLSLSARPGNENDGDCESKRALEPRFFNPANSPLKFGTPERPSQNVSHSCPINRLSPLTQI